MVARIAAGTLAFAALIRAYVHAHLGYRFAESPDGATAPAWEAAIRRGALHAGPPLLNPERVARTTRGAVL